MTASVQSRHALRTIDDFRYDLPRAVDRDAVSGSVQNSQRCVSSSRAAQLAPETAERCVSGAFYFSVAP